MPRWRPNRSKTSSAICVRAGQHPRPGAQQRRRPLEPFVLLENHGPKAGGAPTGKLGDAIKTAFGSFDDFKAKFEAAGIGRFGSGWAWLVTRRQAGNRLHAEPGQPI